MKTQTTSPVPHEEYSLRLLYAAIIDLGHINKLRMLRIRVYWGARLEPVDPDMTSTCHVLD